MTGLILWRHNPSLCRWELSSDTQVHGWIADEVLATLPSAARARFAADVRERYGLALPARAFGSRSSDGECSDPYAPDGCPWEDHEHDPRLFHVVDGEWRRLLRQHGLRNKRQP